MNLDINSVVLTLRFLGSVIFGMETSGLLTAAAAAAASSSSAASSLLPAVAFPRFSSSNRCSRTLQHWTAQHRIHCTAWRRRWMGSVLRCPELESRDCGCETSMAEEVRRHMAGRRQGH